jgi:hypothetical protein
VDPENIPFIIALRSTFMRGASTSLKSSAGYLLQANNDRGAAAIKLGCLNLLGIMYPRWQTQVVATNY